MKVQDIQSVQEFNLPTIPFYIEAIKAGFPSPADDFGTTTLDLNTHLIKHPASTFFVRAQGTSMEKSGIFSGDILIVDRSLEPYDNAIIIANVESELCVRRIVKIKNKFHIISDTSENISNANSDFEVWGVVTYVIHRAQ